MAAHALSRSPLTALVLAAASLFSAHVSSLMLSTTCIIPQAWTVENIVFNGQPYVILTPPPKEELQLMGETLPYERRASFSGPCRFNVHGVRVHFSGGCSLGVSVAQGIGSSATRTSLTTVSWNPSTVGLSSQQPMFNLQFGSASPQAVNSTIVFTWSKTQGSRWDCLVFSDFISRNTDTGLLTSDVDECSSDGHGCIAENQTCVNTFGSYCCSPISNSTESSHLPCFAPTNPPTNEPVTSEGKLDSNSGQSSSGESGVNIVIPILAAILGLLIILILITVVIVVKKHRDGTLLASWTCCTTSSDDAQESEKGATPDEKQN